MRKNHIKIPVSFTLKALCWAFFILAAIQILLYINEKLEIGRFSEKIASIEASRAVQSLAVQLKKVETLMNSVAGDLTSGKLEDRELAPKLVRIMKDYSGIFSIGAAFDPGPEGNVRGMWYVRSGADGSQVTEAQPLDYSKEEWYKSAAAGKASWSEPYRDKASGAMVEGISVPFKGGVLSATISTDRIRAIAGAFKFGDTGYGYILSHKGLFIYHPVADTVESQKSIFEIASERNTPQAGRLLEATKKALAGERVGIDITNHATSQSFRIYYRPIADSGWVLGAIFPKSEMLGDENLFRKQKMWIALSMILGLTIFSAVAFRVYDLKVSSLWLVSASFSILCIAGASYICYLALSAPLLASKDTKIFTDMISVNRFMEKNTEAVLTANRKPPVYVPTGIFVQSLEFEGSNDLHITGYVWQRYPEGFGEKLKEGFVMPEAKSLSVREAYRKKADKAETVGWYFEATTRQQFDYSKYPFDRPNIRIWLRPADFMSNIILVPDMASYKFPGPSGLPGLQERTALPGYAFIGSYFNSERRIRRTNFGFASKHETDSYPELYYNIIVKRIFITPFVSKLFPLFIMFAILFVVQLMFSQDEEKKKAFGLSAFAVVGVVITFFFSILLSHTSLRQDLGSDKIIFIENFHFIAYTMLLLVTIKTLLFIGNRPIRFIQYKNGLIPKLLYWPIFTGFILVVSFIHFY